MHHCFKYPCTLPRNRAKQLVAGVVVIVLIVWIIAAGHLGQFLLRLAVVAVVAGTKHVLKWASGVLASPLRSRTA